ncbi:MAG TPA: YceI family protein [Acidimicrobiales bacterium]|nr:YceI family protein [Acidimicrobiales bacterium]
MARYEIVPDRSTVWIDASSSLHPIHSEVRGVTGFVDVEFGPSGDLDFAATPSGRIELLIDKMSSGNPLYDREMKRRVEARRFPSIEGELTAIEPADGEGAYTVRGNVMFKGVTNAYEDGMHIVAREDLVVLEGEHVFDVRDFGMEPPKIMMLKVHPEVSVRVELTAKRGG